MSDRRMCLCCGRQIVSYNQSNDRIVYDPNPVILIGGYCCKDCNELDENGIFPEERGLAYN